MQALLNHNLNGASIFPLWQYHSMETDDKNGGPNNLKAWREFRKMSQALLAKEADTTQHQIAYLESGERGLSAKWLRKLAPALNTTPGMLLDHDPNTLPTNVIEIWVNADARQKRQISEIARTIVADGTNG